MGNRYATARCAGEGGQQPANLPPLPPLTAEAPRGQSGGPATAGLREERRAWNPGEFEELGKKIKEQINPQFFEGCKVALGKGLSRYFQTTHTVVLGTSQPASYQYGVTYVGSKKIADNDYRPIMLGEISTNGNFSALFLHQIAKAWKVKINTQWVAYQGSLDYQGSDFTASLTLANPNLLDGSVVGVAQYLQALNPSYETPFQAVSGCRADGSERSRDRGGDGVGGRGLSLPGLGGYARLGLHSWHLTYLHKLKDLDLVAECEGSLMQGTTVAAIGYKMDLGAMTMRGRINSLGTVVATVEKRLDPIPGALMVSGRINHWTDEAKFGIGLLIG
ncbi:Mitochondrial import receptor subunit TOM40 homolog 1 [Geodia barretti]|uniref:Mitochondrial import receptor subunit TOM40 homolog 1 n=1 Tax=Geodia barretti TaxID=519541 RepID=A0AA35WQB9_GEOBA|nr:Mitochondrial import receptor subunit TOM40 homolog 1 [Geodia barretti]